MLFFRLIILLLEYIYILKCSKNTLLSHTIQCVLPPRLKPLALAPVLLRPLLLNIQSALIGLLTQARASITNNKQQFC